MKIRRALVTTTIVGIVALGILVFLARQQALSDRHMMTSAIIAQIDAHSSNIAGLLETMSTNEPSAIEDAAYAELQRVPSTSLITRPDIRVMRTADGIFQCVIDTSRYGVPTRSIRQHGPTGSLSPNALQPTRVDAFSSAFAVDILDSAWLNR